MSSWPDIADIVARYEEQPVSASVTQASRWTYHIFVVQGLCPVYESRCFGRRRAERIAQRKLDRYVDERRRVGRWEAERTVFKRDP